MTAKDILGYRLSHQQITQARFTNPADVVRWLGVVQAQDYLNALWAVGLRMRHAVETVVEQALTDRSIIRTWPLRGTLHFVAAEDARWMLALSKPRIVSKSAKRLKKEAGLDDKVFAKSEKVLIRALEGKKQLSREALYDRLNAAKISTADQRGLHILWRHAQDGLICFGCRDGKQQTFALLDEWIPLTKKLSHDEAIFKLAHRYFISHGPATLQDFIWWSGLAPDEARAGLESVRAALREEKIDNQIYWMSRDAPGKIKSSGTYLLPNYDEFMVGYTDRSASLNTDHKDHGNGIFKPIILINGKAAGTWKRTLKKDTAEIETTPFTSFSAMQSKAILAAARSYGKFVGKEVTLI
jgi:hypothetical protein